MEREQTAVQVPQRFLRSVLLVKSGFARAIGKLMLAGSAVLPLAYQTHAGGQDAPEIERVIAEVKTAPVSALIRWLDHDEFHIREAAKREIERRATEHVLRHGKPPLWVTALTPIQDGDGKKIMIGDKVIVEKASLEVLRRLEDSRTTIEQCDGDELFRGTQSRIPREGQTVRSVLARLSEQLGRPVGFYGASNALGEQRVDVPPGDLWQTVRGMQIGGGKRFNVYASHSGAVDLHVVESAEMLTASEGALYISLDPANGRFQVLAEPKMDVRSWKVTGLSLRYPDGSIEDCADYINPDRSIRKHADFADPKKGTELQVTVTFTGHRVRSYTVDPDQPSTFETPAGTFRFHGVARTPNDLGAYEAMVEFPEALPYPPPRIRCFGKNAKGEHLPAVTMAEGYGKLQCGFGRDERPSTLTYAVPDSKPPYGSSGEFVRTLTIKHPQ